MFGVKNSAASQPGYDPTTGTVPSSQPNATMDSIKAQAAAKRAARKAARNGEADLTPAQKSTLSQLQESQAQQDGVVVLNKPSMRRPGRQEQVIHQTLPVLSTKDQIDAVGLPVKDHVASQAASYINEPDIPVSPEDAAAEEQFYEFEDAMTSSQIYAGVAANFKELEEGTYRHIIVDTSGSMQVRDNPTSLHRQSEPGEPVFLQPQNLDPSWNSVPTGGNRIGEAKARLKAALPNLLRANTEGTIFFETFSRLKDTSPKYNGFGGDRFGTLTLDTSLRGGEDAEAKYQRNLKQAYEWVDSLDYDRMDTPTATMLQDACEAAVQENRLGRTQITLMTDGAASDRLSDLTPATQSDFRQFERNVARGRSDFINASGQSVPNSVAKHWYMDADTKEIDRVISFIVGKYGIPMVFAACTNDDKALGELNEMDGYHSGEHSALAVLDDQKAEAIETRVHNPWFKMTPDMANIALWLGAKMRPLDLLDERPLTIEEKEEITGYQVNIDNAEAELAGTELAVKAENTRDKRVGGGLASRFGNMSLAS